MKLGMRCVVAALAVVCGAAGVAQAEDTPDANPMSGDAKAIREGKSWFMNVCSVCHGGKADGAGDRGTAADLRGWNKGFKRFVETVKNGKDTGRNMTMPAWGSVLEEKTIYQIGAFLETLATDGADWKQGKASRVNCHNKIGGNSRMINTMRVLCALALPLTMIAQANAGEGTVTWHDPSCGFFVLTLPEGQPERFGLFSWKSGGDPQLEQTWEGDLLKGEDVDLVNKASGAKMAAFHWADAKEQKQLVRNTPVQCASKWKKK